MTVESCAGGTVPSFLRNITAAFGDRDAVVDERGRMTYADLEARSRALAGTLLGLGVVKYARVGLAAPNSADWVTAWFAAARIGAVAVPISTFSTPAELVRIVRHADCQVLLSRRAGTREGAAAQLLAELPHLPETRSGTGLRCDVLPHLRHVIDLDGGSSPLVESIEAQQSARSSVPDDLLAAAEDSVHPSDPATMIYTSGSTSDPKGVIHSHRGVITQTANVAHELSFAADTRNYTTMPFFWVGGLGMSLLPTLAMGGLHATTETVNPAQILDLIARERLDRVFVYPQRNLDAVLSHPDYASADLSSVTRGTPGIPRDHDESKGISFTRDGLSMGLGMSETFGPYWWGKPAAAPDHYTPPLARANAGFSIRVVKEDGEPAGEGQRGEIRVRGPHLAIGLQKIERSVVFDEDGYYRTGDIGVVEGGCIRYRGRTGDMIKVDGANVAAAEVVAALTALPGVAAAFVVPVRGERGQAIGAGVVAEQGVVLDPVVIRGQLEQQLARYKVPTLLRVFDLDDVPMTVTGKLDQRKFAHLLQERAPAATTNRTSDQEVRT